MVEDRPTLSATEMKPRENTPAFLLLKQGKWALLVQCSQVCHRPMWRSWWSRCSLYVVHGRLIATASFYNIIIIIIIITEYLILHISLTFVIIALKHIIHKKLQIITWQKFRFWGICCPGSPPFLSFLPFPFSSFFPFPILPYQNFLQTWQTFHLF